MCPYAKDASSYAFDEDKKGSDNFSHPNAIKCPSLMINDSN